MNLSAVMAGHSASKTRVNTLMPGHPRLSYLITRKKVVDARHKAGHDGVCGEASASFRHRRDRDRDRADIVATVDDLARLIRADDTGVVLLQHGLLAADDHRQFALE